MKRIKGDRQKIAIVSHVVPPMWSGQSIVLYRLLVDIDPDVYCLISSSADLDSTQPYMRRLPGTFHRLQPDYKFTRGYRFGLQVVREYANALIGVLLRASKIRRVLLDERCRAVVVCSGDFADVPAALLASIATRIPYYLYFFDYYAYQFTDRRLRRLAKFFEPLAIRRAQGVIVPNEMLQQELFARYKLDSTVIHNPCDMTQYGSQPEPLEFADGSELRIVYTGAVYDAHHDAFRNLIAAIKRLQNPNLKLHLYTAQSAEHLSANGIAGPIVIHEHQPASAIPQIQQRAHVLFLPLAFDSPYPEIIKTSAPGKVGEYLAAGRPVLVHAPKDSFVSWYFRTHDCGFVVDESNPATLAAAIKKILADSSLRQRLSFNAWERAQVDFSIAGARATFAQLTELEQEARG